MVKIEKLPPNILGQQRKLALLFKKLASLRTFAPLFKTVETLPARPDTGLRGVDGTDASTSVGYSSDAKKL